MDNDSSASRRFCCGTDTKIGAAVRSAAVPLAVAGGLAGVTAGAMYFGLTPKRAAQLSMGAAFYDPATVPTGPVSRLAMGAQKGAEWF